ncbi:urease accessory protein UreD [Oceanomicrobium pacificus]|uniref:Urease accessory protein UreD n=1 Tax=Oceanomicrobium pacificus TaxID=2692916 RepID=A0A6B0TMU2_9RHOB|nr:urease accessory protein UreD [Oceanomicrobium pacificus]MXU65910.1 urease accessory protein [Oceanomicrobium pacificus]
MTDTLSIDRPGTPQPPVTLQRVRGRAAIVQAATGLRRLHQAGSAKILRPRTYGGPDQAVLINTAGGLTGGDRLDVSAEVDPGGALVVTSQTAERIYRSAGGAAQVRNRLTVGAGARLDWLPQETILFDGAALDRQLDVTLAGDARFLAAESFLFGRAAMGETIAKLALSDRWHIRRDGEPLYRDRLDLCLPRGGSDPLRDPAALAGHLGLGTVLMVTPDAEARTDGLRAAISGLEGLTSGVSGWDGKLLLRILARDGQALRRGLLAALGHVRDDPLPRVWHM